MTCLQAHPASYPPYPLTQTFVQGTAQPLSHQTQHAHTAPALAMLQQGNNAIFQAYLDDSHTATEASNALVQLFTLILLLCLSCQVADLLYARLHLLLCGAVTHNRGRLLVDGHLQGQAGPLSSSAVMAIVLLPNAAGETSFNTQD